MGEPARTTSLGVRTQQQANNFVHGLKQSPVKKVLVNGLHMAFVNTTAAFTTEFLNFYLESRGLNQRRIAMLPVPNPDRQESINPRKRTF